MAPPRPRRLETGVISNSLQNALEISPQIYTAITYGKVNALPHTAPEGDVEKNTMDTQDDDAGEFKFARGSAADTGEDDETERILHSAGVAIGKHRERGVGIGKNERRQQHNDDMKPEGDSVESESTGYATTTSSLQATTRVLFSPPTRFPQCNFAVEPAAMYKQTGLLLKNTSTDNDESKDHGLETENTGYATTTSSSLQAKIRVLFSPSTRTPLYPRDVYAGFREFVADGSAQ